MPEPIIYQFLAAGHGDVVSAIRSIDVAARESARTLEATGRSGAAVGRETERGAGGARRGLTELQRIALRVAADQERAAKRASAAQEREAVRAVAAANRAGKAQERAAQQTAKAQERAAQQAAKAAERAHEYVYRLKQRYLEKEERDAERSAQKIAKAQERARTAHFRDAARFGGGVVDRGVSALVGLGRSAFSTGATLVGGAVRESMETQGIANRVSVNARMNGQEGADPTTLRKEFEHTAMATGQNAADVGRAAQAYVDLTGDLASARRSLETFGTVATATGATVEDVATAAASIGKNFDVKSMADMQKVMATLVFQGKGGAVTMRDLASQMQKLASAGAAYNMGKGPEAVSTLGGLLQVARTGTRSPQQAGTAVENIFAGLTAHQKNLKAAGISLYDKQGGKRNIYEVLAETVSKVGGTDMGKKSSELLKIFGKQGSRGINPLMAAYQDATQGLHGKEAQQAGYEAIKAALESARNAAADYAEVQKDAASVQEQASSKLSVAWETLKSAVGDRLMPTFAELVGKLASDGKALDAFLVAVDLAADGLAAVTDRLKEAGIISGGTPEEKAAAADKQANRLGKSADRMLGDLAAYGDPSQLSGQKLDEYNEKKAAYDAARAKANSARDDANTLGAKANEQSDAIKAIGSLTGDDAAKEYEARYRKAGGKVLGPTDARDIGTLGGLIPNDVLPGLLGEKAEQREIRHAYEGDDGRGGGGAGADKMGAAADKHASAADKLMSAAVALASIVSGGSIGGASFVPRVPGAK